MSDHLNEDILMSATAMLSENWMEIPEDYQDRATYLIGQFYLQCEDLDTRYRKAHGIKKDYTIGAVYSFLDDEFLFVNALAPAAIYYLAAMLAMDENEVLGDKLFALYADEVSKVEASLPFVKEKITEVY